MKNVQIKKVQRREVKRAAHKINWPFTDMAVGDAVEIEGVTGASVNSAIWRHTTSQQGAGQRFIRSKLGEKHFYVERIA